MKIDDNSAILPYCGTPARLRNPRAKGPEAAIFVRPGTWRDALPGCVCHCGWNHFRWFRIYFGECHNCGICLFAFDSYDRHGLGIPGGTVGLSSFFAMF